MSHPGTKAALVIGVGNPFRRDDGVGPSVARALKDASLPGVDITEQSGEGASLLESWRDAPLVILIDAVASGAAPGSVYRFEIPDERMPTRFFNYSTHAFSVAEAIELARALDLLPGRMIVYGIEGADFGSGEGLSMAVRSAAARVLAEIRSELEPMTINAAKGA